MNVENENKNITDEEEKIIGATESRLLQAMAMADENADDAGIMPLQDFIADAGKELSSESEKAKMYDIIQDIRTVSYPEIPLNVYYM